MENNISQTILFIIKLEGGYVNHPNDTGGPTKYGITQQTLTNHIGRRAEIEDVKAMQIQTAIDIIYQKYFLKPNVDRLPNSLQPLMLDMAVNHGPSRAIKILQKELHYQGYNPGVIDGLIGKKTINSTENACDKLGWTFINYVIDQRVRFYKYLVEKNQDQIAFLDGWMNRTDHYRPGNQQVYT